MNKLYDYVINNQNENTVIIPRSCLRLCKGDYNLAAVLMELITYSYIYKDEDNFFWIKNEEFGLSLDLTVDQVRYSIKKIKKILGGSLTTYKKKIDGVPVVHYRFDEDEIIKLIKNLEFRRR
jgi:hypothetical protein